MSAVRQIFRIHLRAGSSGTLAVPTRLCLNQFHTREPHSVRCSKTMVLLLSSVGLFDVQLCRYASEGSQT